MARLTPAQEMEAAAHDSLAPAHDVSSSSSNAANAILQRHRGPRQRFDSADYVLGDHFQRALALKATQNSTAAGCIEPATKDRCRASGPNDVEFEPEPEHCHLGAKQCHSFPRQSVRRLRLQRFDSADWAMQLDSDHIHAVHGSDSSGDGDSEAKPSPAQHGNVAHLLLERHAYRTCTALAVGMAGASTSSRCAEQA